MAAKSSSVQEQELEQLDRLIQTIQTRFLNLLQTVPIGRTQILPNQEEVPEDIRDPDVREVLQQLELQRFQSGFQTTNFVQSCELLLQMVSDLKVSMALNQPGDTLLEQRRTSSSSSSSGSDPKDGKEQSLDLQERFKLRTQVTRAAMRNLGEEIGAAMREIEQHLAEH